MLGLEILPFAVALVHDWRAGGLARFLPRWRALVLRRLVQAVLVALAVAAVAIVVGHTGLGRALVALFVLAPSFGLIAAALAWVLNEAVAALLATPLMRTLRSVRERADAIRRAAHMVIVLFCWALGIAAFTFAHSAFDDLVRVAGYVANASVSAGEVTITFSAILSALSVVVVTWLVTKLVRFLLDHEILPRLDLRTGVPIAISTIVGYVLVVTGFVLTMAALGIDLTKVTLLAGALGIGVGLGLQSVVHNFASGLILMLERPINVGDQIDVGGVVGEVRRIGVRSSTIRTGQGAEVIVPNADLASKQVINWTLSDRARRYEIDVGVAYGSDPAQVLRLLESAAATVPEVQQNPPPRALFTRIRRQLARLPSLCVGGERGCRPPGAERPADGRPPGAGRGRHRDPVPAARSAHPLRRRGARSGRCSRARSLARRSWATPGSAVTGTRCCSRCSAPRSRSSRSSVGPAPVGCCRMSCARRWASRSSSSYSSAGASGSTLAVISSRCW